MRANLSADPESLAPLAAIPEHSLPLMRAFSGGEPIFRDNYLFFKKDNSLMAIGYPLRGDFASEAFENAIESLATEFDIAEIHAIAPAFSETLSSKVIESDRFYVLSASAPIPKKLLNAVKKAASRLRIQETNRFTPAHRKLWREFLGRRLSSMPDRVRELYAATPQALLFPDGSLRLLDAYDAEGNLTASLLLDHAPANFSSYILGAHSDAHYIPHAMDALFAAMLANAQKSGKRFIHLGLGVNSGILRFKRKWGAVPSLPYRMAQWNRGTEREAPFTETICRVILQPRDSGAMRRLIATQPPPKPFAMLWEVSKNGRRSWLAGTAHFFLHSFEPSFRKLFDSVENVLFEGPLDPDFMAQVRQYGSRRPASMPSLLTQLSEKEIKKLIKTISGDFRPWSASLPGHSSPLPDVPHLLATAWPWYAFFTLWTTFLERLGWKQSVDMEAWNIARDMGKNVIGMENLEEQLESLQSLPMTRAVNFFKDSASWKRRARQNLKAYLAGDLEYMMGSSAEFPTRTEHIVGRRDQRFKERMLPWLEKGDAAVFVGSAHLVNLRHLLADEGFSVRQKPFGILPRLKLAWREMRRPDERVRW